MRMSDWSSDVCSSDLVNPEQIGYGSTGVGTDDHLALVLFEDATGAELNHVPYNGAGPLRNAVLGGHTDVGGMNLGEAMPYSGKNLRILGQASEKRSPLAPRSAEHTSELQSLMRSSYAVFCLKKKNNKENPN